MASSYRGQYRLGPKDVPTDIQVVDLSGNSILLPLDVYVARDGQPDWRKLPTDRQYLSILGVSRLEEGEPQVINVSDAQECVEAGWLDALAAIRWTLTEAGKKFL
jgi:hypothetical protein